MRTRFTLLLLSVFFAASVGYISCTKKSENKIGVQEELIGSWKLVGIWDAYNNELIPFEDNDNKSLCELSFLTNNVLQGFSSSYNLNGNYKFMAGDDISFRFSVAKAQGKSERDIQFVDALRCINSFELNDDVLKLFYMKQNNYLLLHKK